MNIFKKIIIGLFGSFLLKPFLKSKIFIFCFHDISDVSAEHHSEYYSTENKTFIKHLNFIKKNFEIISIEKIKNKELLDKDKRYAIITFDDGFISVLNQAHPILKENNIPYTIFLNQSAIEKNQLWCSNLVIYKKNIDYLKSFYSKCFIEKTEDNYSDFINNKKLPVENLYYANLKYDKNDNNDKIYASQSDIQYLIEHYPLVTIGNHTSNHFNLAKCSHDLQVEEIVNNHNFIKQTFGINTEHFAIPFGKKSHFSEETIDILSKNNYTNIYSTNPTYVDLKANNTYTVFPRIGVTNQTISELIFYINRTLFKKLDL